MAARAYTLVSCAASGGGLESSRPRPIAQSVQEQCRTYPRLRRDVRYISIMNSTAVLRSPSTDVAGVGLADARTILTPASGFIRRYRYSLNPYGRAMLSTCRARPTHTSPPNTVSG